MKKIIKAGLSSALAITLAMGMVVPTQASELDTLSSTVTATVASNEASYIMTIPAEFHLGELSAVDNVGVAYDVQVEIFPGNSGSAVYTVTSAEYGELKSGDDTIEFYNTFGTQTYGYTQTISAHLLVWAEEVAGAAPGNYEGQVNFSISKNE